LAERRGDNQSINTKKNSNELTHKNYVIEVQKTKYYYYYYNYYYYYY